MEFFDVVRNRHSIREFLRKEVEEDKIQKILETANSAPSAGNLQAFEIFVIKDKDKKKALSEAAWNQDFVRKAPLVLVFCAHPKRSASRYGNRGEQLYSIQDATIAAAYAQLAVAGLGLGTVWVGAFEDEDVLKILKDDFGVVNGLVPVCILPIGYPKEKGDPSPRRDLNDIVHEI